MSPIQAVAAIVQTVFRRRPKQLFHVEHERRNRRPTREDRRIDAILYRHGG